MIAAVDPIKEVGNKMFRILSLMFLVLISFGGKAESLGEEISRVTSPDKVVDAVVIETSKGATTSFKYSLYIVPSGQNIEGGIAKLVGDHFSDFEIKWKDNKFLEISYTNGRIFEFSNFWQSKEVQNYSYVVELRLNPLTKSFSLNERDRWIGVK